MAAAQADRLLADSVRIQKVPVFLLTKASIDY